MLMQQGPAGYFSLSGIKTGIKCYNSIRTCIVLSLLVILLIATTIQIGFM